MSAEPAVMNAVAIFLCLAVASQALPSRNSQVEVDRQFGRLGGVSVQNKTMESSRKPTVNLKAPPLRSHTDLQFEREPPPYYAPPETFPKKNARQVDVFQMSNGLQAVALDDPKGHVIDYLYLGINIPLLYYQGYYLLPVTDLLAGGQRYTLLDTANGHLSLSELTVNSVKYQGLKGYDQLGPIFVPVQQGKNGPIVRAEAIRPDSLKFYTPDMLNIYKNYKYD